MDGPRRLARAALTVLAAPLAAAAPAAAQVPFAHRVVDPGFHGDCKALGDLDGDGRLDIAVGGEAGLRWYRAPAWTATVVAQPLVQFTTDMQTGDVDGDGDLDLVVPEGEVAAEVRRRLRVENGRPGSGPVGSRRGRAGR